MNYSQRLAEFVKAWEGLRLEPYLDAVGVPTIGYGHVLAPSAPRPLSINVEMANIYLADDLDAHAAGVNELVTTDLHQHEFDALVDFAFNLGVGSLSRSTLLRKVNARKFYEAAEEFSRWVYAGDKRLIGLVKRREAEESMFLHGNYLNFP